jgi:PAS domain S-box-containing protein
MPPRPEPTAAAAVGVDEDVDWFRTLADNAPDIIVRFDREMRYLYANAAAERATGLGRTDIIGRTNAQLAMPSGLVEQWHAAIEGVFQRAQPAALEFELTTSRGTHQLEARLVPEFDRRGGVRSVLAVARDITERKRVDAALRRYELLAGHSRDAIVFMRRDDGRILEANAAAVTAYGYTHEELLGLTIHDLRAPDTRRLTSGQMTDADTHGILFETAHRRKDGSTFPVEVSSQGATIHGVRTLISVIRDITERKRAQEALGVSEERQRLALRAGRLTTWEVDLRSGARLLSDDAGPLYGMPPKWAPASWDDWASRLHPEDRERITDAFEALVRSDAPYREEYRIVRPDGTTRWIESQGAVVRDASGEAVRAYGVASDVTERKQAEDALRQADRRKNEFLGVLSHELRNPLAPIRSALYILDRAAPGTEQAERAREIISRQANHLARIVDDLLDVTRISRGKIQIRLARIELGELVRRTVEDHRTLFTDRAVELVLRAPDGPLWVDADATRLAQVVGNLLHNAAKFTSARGHVAVAVERDGPSSVAVRVRDDGIGIAPEVLPHLFEPFRQADDSLHRSLGGLGLGLALVKGLVEMHRGCVQARSDGLGRGAELSVVLPLQRPDRAVHRAAAPARARLERRRVLVIEDNVDSAQTLKEVLELHGQDVAVAHDGQDGVDKARALRPDIVFCDIGLPGLDGYEVARQIRADPGISPLLVAVTGYARPDDQKRALDAGFDQHIGKPLEVELLAQILAAATPPASS